VSSEECPSTNTIGAPHHLAGEVDPDPKRRRNRREKIALAAADLDHPPALRDQRAVNLSQAPMVPAAETAAPVKRTGHRVPMCIPGRGKTFTSLVTPRRHATLLVVHVHSSSPS
jgi:hypothetical protein